MKVIVLEIVFIFLLLVINGIFAMAEIAMVSASKGRLRRLAENGDARAQLALELASAPNRFLSTVQIGITLVGILAGAVSGATIAAEIGHTMQAIPGLAPYAQSIGLVSVVVIITFASLLFGELVPKRIGLSNPEGIAMAVARPMQTLSVLAGPVVRVLSATTEALLRFLPLKAKADPPITEEEVQILMQEGLRAGAFNKVESQIVTSALELDELVARDLMTPRPKIIWLNRNDPHEMIWHKIVVSGHSNFPVYEGNRDNVVGMVSLKAIYANMAAGIPLRLADLMTPPLVVPNTQKAIELLEIFKHTGKHTALIADEFGTMVGLITLHDVMEAIVGEFPSQQERAKPQMKRRDDNSWLIDATIEIERVEAGLGANVTDGNQTREYQTLAGFVVSHLGHVPKEGETFEWRGYLFEVLDMDRHRVDKVLVTPAPGKNCQSAA